MALLRSEGGIISQNFQMPIHSHVSHYVSQERGFERYSNHDGTLTNYMTTTLAGAGAAATVALTHKLALTIGDALNGGAAYHTKDTYIINATRPIIATWKVQDITAGADGTRAIQLGARYDGLYNGDPGGNGSFFHMDGAGVWTCNSTYVVFASDPATIVNGDVLTLRILSRSQEFYVNGVLIATHDLGAPGPNVYTIFASINNVGAVTTPPAVSIDYFDLKVF